MVDWGDCYYLKGSLLSAKPSDDINPKKFQQLIEIISGEPDYTVLIQHEFFPHKKINSIPTDATPYRRDLTGHALIVLKWKENSPEKNAKARELTHAISDMMPKGEGYGNYGAFSFLLHGPLEVLRLVT